jgi:hypothetical protein
MSTREKLKSRLNTYWQMEAFNAVIAIPIAILISISNRSPVGTIGLLSLSPAIMLLIVGALYWRGKYRQLLGETKSLHRALDFADSMEWPSRIGCFIVTVLCIVVWAFPSVSAGLGDRIMTTIGAALAVVEHVNYYHRQLQHFDHLPDLKRLFTGKGFRPAQMSVDLQKWRSRKTTAQPSN